MKKKVDKLEVLAFPAGFLMGWIVVTCFLSMVHKANGDCEPNLFHPFVYTILFCK